LFKQEATFEVAEDLTERIFVFSGCSTIVVEECWVDTLL
jgi:hypothetical protein